MHEAGERVEQDRLWTTLERILVLDAMDLETVLDQAAQIAAEALGADKVDAFVYEAETMSLVALGTSDTPMGRQQQAMGLDRLPLVNGGRAVEVFRSGQRHIDGNVEADPDELEGIKSGLGVRSAMLRRLDVAGERRGVLSAVSARPDDFSVDDAALFNAIGPVFGHWLTLVLHRAELVLQLGAIREERGRLEENFKMLQCLTPRQREVATLIAHGSTNGEIADRLAVSEGTVANHVENILRRLGFRSRAAVAALVAEVGVLRLGVGGPGLNRTAFADSVKG